MQDEIRVHIQVLDDKIAIISLAGEVTTCAERAIKRAYQQVSAHNVNDIIFNFKETDYIDCLGICILIDVITRARQKNQRLIMNLPSAHTQKIFRIVGLNHYTNISTSLDEALIGVRAGFANNGRRKLARA